MPKNVSRETLRMLRGERRRNPTLAMLIARRRSETAAERSVRERAEEIHRRFQADGPTWAACVQAVKTGWVASLIAKVERQRERGSHPPEVKRRN